MKNNLIKVLLLLEQVQKYKYTQYACRLTSADWLKCTMCNCIYIKLKRLCKDDQGHHHFEIQIVKLDKVPDTTTPIGRVPGSKNQSIFY